MGNIFEEIFEKPHFIISYNPIGQCLLLKLIPNRMQLITRAKGCLLLWNLPCSNVAMSTVCIKKMSYDFRRKKFSFFDGQYLWKIASNYTIYEYIYKVKKPAAARARPPAAALCGQQIGTCAHYRKVIYYISGRRRRRLQLKEGKESARSGSCD